MNETAVSILNPPPRPSPGPDTTRLVDAFLSGRNERTLEAYRQDLEDFRAFVGALTLDEAARLLLDRGHGEANGLALAYKSALVDRGLAANSINRRLAALRSLVRLARTLGLVSWTLEISNIKAQPYRDTRGPGREGFVLMLDALGKREGAKAIRDRAILRLLFDLALRRAEVCSLDLADVALEAGAVAVLGKGKTERIRLTLPPETTAVLADWLSVRGDEPGPLFLNFDRAGKGRRLTGRGLYSMIRKLGEGVGLRTWPHGLRHAAVTEALDLTNGNLRAVQRFSRHKDVRILTIYDDNRQDLGGEVARKVASNGSHEVETTENG
ncbi:MAG: tyrosine-type recombinase/integrase [Nitrospinota bacterium]|nr:tyrosine-type recombinase/integrase [Nitrospinota bacterium]MDP7384618.1 tyrosine-type recombinase/integrase [Nitrospinota bacterium]